jgi:hypothetical protein
MLEQNLFVDLSNSFDDNKVLKVQFVRLLGYHLEGGVE